MRKSIERITIIPLTTHFKGNNAIFKCETSLSSLLIENKLIRTFNLFILPYIERLLSDYLHEQHHPH